MTEPTHIRRDLERLAEARALLEKCVYPISLAESDAENNGALGFSIKLEQLQKDVIAWLAHDDEERDDG